MTSPVTMGIVDAIAYAIEQAEQVGSTGKFLELTGVSRTGRPVVIFIGVGDGASALHLRGAKPNDGVERLYGS